MVYMITDGLIIFDNLKDSIIVLTHAHVKDNKDQAYTDALSKLDDLKKAVNYQCNDSIIKVPENLSIINSIIVIFTNI